MEQLQSPFAIPHEDIEALNGSEGFCMLRNYLARSAEYVTFSLSYSRCPKTVLITTIASATTTANATLKRKKPGCYTATFSMRSSCLSWPSSAGPRLLPKQRCARAGPRIWNSPLRGKQEGLSCVYSASSPKRKSGAKGWDVQVCRLPIFTGSLELTKPQHAS